MSGSKNLVLILFVFITYSAAHANEILKLSHYTFQYSATTTASAETIWALWRDVDNWKDFDERLKYSYLADGEKFEKGAVGYLKAHTGPRTKFVLTEVDDGKSFTEMLSIPLYQKIALKRYFVDNDNGTITFTHEVVFKGRLRSVSYALLCRSFKKDLKLVVKTLKEIAENKETDW